MFVFPAMGTLLHAVIVDAVFTGQLRDFNVIHPPPASLAPSSFTVPAHPPAFGSFDLESDEDAGAAAESSEWVQVGGDSEAAAGRKRKAPEKKSGGAKPYTANKFAR